MELIGVTSSMIYAAGYDAGCERLEVVYFNAVYRYYDVPQELFDGLLAAESKGRYNARLHPEPVPVPPP